ILTFPCQAAVPMPAKAREGPAAFISERLAQAASSVFEAETEEDDVMHRPLRSPSKPVFSLPLLASGACYKVPSCWLSTPFFSSSSSTAACRKPRYGRSSSFRPCSPLSDRRHLELEPALACGEGPFPFWLAAC